LFFLNCIFTAWQYRKRPLYLHYCPGSFRLRTQKSPSRKIFFKNKFTRGGSCKKNNFPKTQNFVATKFIRTTLGRKCSKKRTSKSLNFTLGISPSQFRLHSKMGTSSGRNTKNLGRFRVLLKRFWTSRSHIRKIFSGSWPTNRK
jgi:hypothetical protein